MRIIKRIIPLILCIIIMVSSYGCAFAIPIPVLNKDDAVEKPEIIDTDFNASTNISYSSGSDSNWSYGNQRKEFPKNETCYARISSTVIAEKRKGIGTEITITYKFTGAKNCKIEISDGIVSKVSSDDDNIEIYTRTISAQKKKKTTESIVIFQYIPNNDASSITLEVTYDDHVPTQYDARNTIYFSPTAE